MQKINIKAGILQRLSTLSTFTTDPLLRCIRLEIKDRKMLAITTNGTVGVIEYLGNIDNVDEVCHIRLNDIIMSMFKTEDVISVETIPELAMGKINGRTDCFLWPDETPLNEWEKWLDPATESKGFMYWDTYQVQMLFDASPTGKIVFPQLIDVTKPIMLRDARFENWLGLFIPRPARDEDINAAILPEWLNADS